MFSKLIYSIDFRDIKIIIEQWLAKLQTVFHSKIRNDIRFPSTRNVNKLDFQANRNKNENANLGKY